MSMFENIKMMLFGGAIGGAAIGGGVYVYTDTQDRTEQYSSAGTDNYIDGNISDVTMWFLHHSVAGTLDDNAKFHKAPKEEGGRGWDGIGYSYALEDRYKNGTEYDLINTRPIDTKGNQAARNNTKTRGLVVEGNFNDKEVSEDLIWEIKHWLYATLKLYPKITKFKPHGDNPWSNTDCPGDNLILAMEEEGLFFDSRAEIEWFMGQMEKRMRYDCDETVEAYFEDGEPC